MKPTLHTFRVFLKRHGERSVRAYKYTEDPESGRTTFHRAPDGSDSETYFQTSEIAGIERELSEQEIMAGSITAADFQSLLDGLPEAQDRDDSEKQTPI